MDGVLADFNTAARGLIRATDAERKAADEAGRWPREKWSSIRDHAHFYRNLPKMPQADQLVMLARRFRDELGWNLRILTAIPHNNDMHEVFQDKFEWIQDFYPDIRVHFGPYSKDKQSHATPGDILVDDRTTNCTEWISAGGVAVQVQSGQYQSAIDQLYSIFDKLTTHSCDVI
jgi:5'(3')-deoxyribonucleotidase